MSHAIFTDYFEIKCNKNNSFIKIKFLLPDSFQGIFQTCFSIKVVDDSIVDDLFDEFARQTRTLPGNKIIC
jgi:hypothetical protein